MMARFIFLSFFMLVGALAPTKAQNSFPYPALPDSLRSVEQRAAYLSEHYWDNFNFSDTLELANKEMAEQGFVNFIDILARFDQEIAQKGITAFTASSIIMRTLSRPCATTGYMPCFWKTWLNRHTSMKPRKKE